MPYYDHNKDYPFAAFITNLGKYNEGELVGEWVKFPTTAEEMKEVFKRIGIGQRDDFGQPYDCLLYTSAEEADAAAVRGGLPGVAQRGGCKGGDADGSQERKEGRGGGEEGWRVHSPA